MKHFLKNYFVLLLLLLCWQYSFAQKIATQDSLKQRPTVAVVLSGGGAKGFAHIGTLEALDKLGIPVDYIVGTSMGSVMGGLYAIGYKGSTIATEVKKQDWENVFTDKVTSRKTLVSLKDELSRYAISFPIKEKIQLPKGIVKGQKVINILTKYTVDYHGKTNFSKFPIPFSCVAVDLETGEDVVFENGYLPQAMRASMAIPSFFTPAEINERLYIDGGAINNFPADVAKLKNYDYIIGVDVQSPLRTKKELQSGADIVNQLVGFAGKPRNEKNKKLTDVYIHPDISGFSTASFSHKEIDSIIQRGREAAKIAYPKLLALKEKLGNFTLKEKVPEPNFEKTLHFNQISIKGIENSSEKLFRRKLKLKNKDSISISGLETKIEDLSAILNFDLLKYRLQNDTLKFIANERQGNRFNVGAHYDSDNNASLLLNVTWDNKIHKNSRLSFDFILGKNLQFTGRYTLNFGTIPYLNFKVDTKRYSLQMHDRNKKTADGDVRYAKFDVNAQAIIWDSYSAGLGVRQEYVNVNNTLSNVEQIPTKINEWFTNFYGFIKFNSLDDNYYGKKGLRFDAEAKLVNDTNGNKATIIYGNFYRPILLSRKFTLLYNVYGRTAIDNQIGIMYENYWGGVNNAKYLDHHLQFMGTNWMQGTNNTMAVGRLDFRYELFRNNYLVLTGNYGHSCEDIDKFFMDSATNIWGGGLTYSYNSIVGPIEVTAMYSTEVKRPLLFVNIGYNF